MIMMWDGDGCLIQLGEFNGLLISIRRKYCCEMGSFPIMADVFLICFAEIREE